jgi:hypothetical protein
LNKDIPKEYFRHLETKIQPIFQSGDQYKLTPRGFWVGCFLSFFLAICAPYGDMILRSTYMALDISTPGAIFIFLCLIGLLNLLFKVAGRNKNAALAFVLLVGSGWCSAYWPFTYLDPYSPGLILSTFVLLSAFINLPLAGPSRGLALNRAELVLVYAMLLTVSALCTMGLSEQLIPMISAIFYYASPQNNWQEKLFPHFPEKAIVVDDGARNIAFYEGLSPGQSIPYEAWVEPLMWWAIFLIALYVVMICIAVILRRQWMEHERLAYPLAQVGLAMIHGEDDKSLVNQFFKQKSMWVGAALPLLIGSSIALNRYDIPIPAMPLGWSIQFIGSQSLTLHISFALVGFSYFISTKVAASIWIFHLIAKMQKALLEIAGIQSAQKPAFGVADAPLLGYQGLGALICMVLVGLWIGREHFKKVFLKAVGKAPQVDDADEILSYRNAVLGLVVGFLVMVGWLWIMGTPLWIALIFVVVALLIFIGVTRIITEAGLATLRPPMIAPDFVVHGLGSTLVGSTGVITLSLAYIWASEIRVFVMATCTNALKLIEDMEPRSRRQIFGGILLALLIGSLGSMWMIFHMAYRHGGINMDGWFFDRMNEVAYENAARNMEPSGVYWPGMGSFLAGGLIMALLMWARQRLAWWPLHPIGFPISATDLLNTVVFSVFTAWAIKSLVLRYGGPSFYRRSLNFFLGLIAGQMFCNGAWQVIDYFTGKMGNRLFGF